MHRGRNLFHAQRGFARFAGTAMSKEPVEIRKKNDAIDEIVIRGGSVHIEQMSNDGWFMGVDAADGSYWQFWFGSKNRKSHVEFRHTETVPVPTPIVQNLNPPQTLMPAL